MPPPGPCEASAALAHDTPATIEAVAIAARDIELRIHDDVMTISRKKKLQKIRR
jgi:hypothetical protein